MTIDLLTAFIIAAITALVVVLVMRSIAARQVAETRAASIAELAATKQDLKWVREDAERKAQALDSAQTLLDKADQPLRDTFQSLAAQALEGQPRRVPGPGEDVLRELSATDRRDIEARGPASRAGRARAGRGVRAAVRTGASRWDRPPTRCRARFARRRSAAAGAKCSFDGSSRSPACCSAATSTSSPALLVGQRPAAARPHRPPSRRQADRRRREGAARGVPRRPGVRRRRARGGARLQAHARQVRDHMDKLGSKAYWEQLADSPEMVVMFLPGETLFSAALQHDLTLIEHGLSRRCCWRAPSRSSPC